MKMPFFNLAIKLLDRQNYAKKFMLIGIVLVIPIVFLMYFYISSKNVGIHFGKQELLGSEYNAGVSKLLLTAEELREQTEAYRNSQGGDASAASAAITRLQQQMEPALTEQDKLDKDLGKKLGTSESWSRIKSDWQSYKSTVLQDSITDPKYANHLTFVDDLLKLTELVANNSNLILDPDLDSYYIMDVTQVKLPAISNLLSRSSAIAAEASRSNQFSPESRTQLLRYMTLLQYDMDTAQADLQTAFNSNPAIKPLLNNQLTEATSLIQQLIKLYNNQILNADQTSPSFTEFSSRSTSAIDAVFKLTEQATPVLDQLLHERIDSFTSQLYQAIIFIAILLALALYLSVAFCISTVGALTNLEKLSHHIASGDLSVTSDYAPKDEIGAFTKSFNHMVASLRTVIGHMKDSAAAVSSASKDISMSTEEIARGSSEQARSTLEMNELLMQQADAINLVARNAEHTSQLCMDTKQISDESSRIVQLSIDSMGTLSSKMTTLQDASMRIGEIIEVIEEIAQQTNLLALNAAIEAARAGEQGRGFSVVADEVRRLAERSSEAAMQITRIIHDMQNNSTESVQAATSAMEYSKRTGQSFETITDKINEMTSQVADIASASEQQSAQTRDVLSSIEGIAAFSEEASAGSQQTAANSQALYSLANKLTQSAASFKF
ncbi:methyl-accepting chemotaxis protein [Paenibacillus taihuensis]|nr:methyl-accepting chemotaxis protein [Paenibacillus taihuensis]